MDIFITRPIHKRRLNWSAQFCQIWSWIKPFKWMWSELWPLSKYFLKTSWNFFTVSPKHKFWVLFFWIWLQYKTHVIKLREFCASTTTGPNSFLDLCHCGYSWNSTTAERCLFEICSHCYECWQKLNCLGERPIYWQSLVFDMFKWIAFCWPGWMRKVA